MRRQPFDVTSQFSHRIEAVTAIRPLSDDPELPFDLMDP